MKSPYYSLAIYPQKLLSGISKVLSCSIEQENGGNHENDATALKVYELVEFQLVALEMVYKNKFHFMHCPHVKIYLVSS